MSLLELTLSNGINNLAHTVPGVEFASRKLDLLGRFSDPRASSADEGKASMTSSAINLVNSVLGTGLLALPRAFAHAGYVWGFALSTLSVLLNILTSVYISEACRQTRSPASYTSIADAALKGYSVVVNVSCNTNLDS